MAAPSPQESAILARAIEHHTAGRRGDAEAGYRQILALQPDHSEALANLGQALLRAGQIEASIAAYTRTLMIAN